MRFGGGEEMRVEPDGGGLGGLLAALSVRVGLGESVDMISIGNIMLLIPGAMDAHLDNPLFWGSLAAALVIAGVAAYPVNRWLIARGRGHSVVHSHHHQ